MITFVRETQGLDFIGAIEWLADRFHIPLEYEETLAGRGRARAAGASGSTRCSTRRPAFYERYLWDSQAGSLARDYLAGRGLRRGDLPRVPARPRARRQHARRARRARRASRADELRAAGLDAPARRRLLPAAARVPARRRARPRGRLPGAAAARGRPAAGEVRQHARVGALPQGLAALRARQVARRDRARRPRVRRRGEHRRDRAAAGGLRAGGRVDGHGAHRAAAPRARRG